MITAQYGYFVDWDNDGDWSEPLEDISAYVLTSEWEYGVDFAAPQGRAKQGAVRLKLDNSTGVFSSYNSASPLNQAPNAVLPGRKVKVTMDGTTMFVAFLESVIPVAGAVPEISTADLVAHGPLSQLSGAVVHLAMQTDCRTDQAFNAIVDAVSTGIATANDTGQTTMSRFFVQRNTDALAILREIEDAETGLVREDKLGRIAFESRAHRLGPPHDAAVATFGSGGLYHWRLGQEDPLTGIYNLVEASVRVFNKTEEIPLATVVNLRDGTGGAAITIPAGQTETVTVEYPNPVTGSGYPAVAEWGMVYLEANSAADLSGDDVTEDINPTRTEYADRIVIGLQNGGASTAYIVVLWVAGKAVAEGDPVPVKSEDGPPTDPNTSQGKYRVRPYPSPSRWLTDLAEAKDYTGHILAIFKEPVARITFDLEANYDAAHLAAARTLDVSDRIHVDAPGTQYRLYINSDFYVEYAIHKVNEARKHVVTYQCRAVSQHTWPASGPSYQPKTIPSKQNRVPDDLQPVGFDPGGRVDVGIVAWKWNADIFEGEIRAKFYASGEPAYVDLRTPEEGGTLTHNPAIGEYILTGRAASWAGCNASFTSAEYGRWYYAGRLKNASGWSVWSDGNDTPCRVTDFVAIESGMAQDGGPPDSSEVTIELVGGGVVPHATRPAINGNTLLFGFVQIKDGNVGAWYDLDANAGPAVTYYDGSAVDHVLDKATGYLSSPTGFPGVTGGLLMLDVRDAGTWDRRWCQWMAFGPGDMIGGKIKASGFRPNVPPDSGQQWRHIRCKIVQPPWEWTGYGYFGDTPGRGLSELEFWQRNGDRTTKQFDFPLIPLPAASPMSNIVGRVFWENKICRAECGANPVTPLEDTGNPAGAYGLQIITHAEDPSVPVGMMRLAWYRDTLNYDTIYAAGFWVSSALPAQGPFSMERAAFPSCTLETGECTVTAESADVSVTGGRTPNPAVVDEILVIYTDDSSPDNDIDAEYVDAEDAGGFTIHPFHKSGTFDYAVIKRWVDTGDAAQSSNLAYLQFKVPDEVGGDVEAIRWITQPVPMPSGPFYVTGASRNSYGLGTRMTADSLAGGGLGCVQLAIVPNSPPPDLVYTVVGESFVFFIDATSDFKLMNPTGNIYCGRPIVYLIRQPVSGGPYEIYFDTKFRFGDDVGAVTLSIAPGAVDYLGVMYFAAEDRFDAVAFVRGYKG